MTELPERVEELAAEPKALYENPEDEDPEVGETLQDHIFFRADEEQEIYVGEDDAGNPLYTRATYFVGLVENAELNPMQRQQLSTELAAEALQDEKDELQEKESLTDDEQDRLDELESEDVDIQSANIDNTDVPDRVQSAVVFASDSDGSVGAPIAAEREQFAGEQLVENGADETPESDLPELQDALDAFESTVYPSDSKNRHDRDTSNSEESGEEELNSGEDDEEEEQTAGIGGVEY